MMDVYGWPVMGFSIDGVQQYMNTFPPGISAALFTNATFFNTPVTPGEHLLTITNLNGTAPNTFWLDYVFYMPLTDAESPPTSSTTKLAIGFSLTEITSHTTSWPRSVSTSHGPTVTSGDGSAVPGGSALPQLSPSGAGLTDPHPSAANHTGAIIGGAVGGIVLLVLVATFVVLRCFRRHEENWDNVDGKHEPSRSESEKANSPHAQTSPRMQWSRGASLRSSQYAQRQGLAISGVSLPILRSVRNQHSWARLPRLRTRARSEQSYPPNAPSVQHLRLSPKTLRHPHLVQSFVSVRWRSVSGIRFRRL